MLDGVYVGLSNLDDFLQFFLAFKLHKFHEKLGEMTKSFSKGPKKTPSNVILDLCSRKNESVLNVVLLVV